MSQRIMLRAWYQIRHFGWLMVVLIQLGAVSVAGQTPIEILNADTLLGERSAEKGSLRRLLGNVRLKQDSTLISCDSAYVYEAENQVEAISNVKLSLPSGAQLSADLIFYDGNTRLAEVFDHVVLTDGPTTLTTDVLFYDRNTATGRYEEGGTLKDSTNTLTSRRGIYEVNRKYARFKDSVRVKGPNYRLKADSLDYETDTRVVRFVTWSVLTGDQGEVLRTQDGYYRTQTAQALLYPRAFYQDTAYAMAGDTLYYDRTQGRGWSRCQVALYNRDSTVRLHGDYGTYVRATQEARLTDDPFLVQLLEGDTLVLFADTLFSVDDSARGRQELKAYPHVRFAMQNLQGVADTALFSRADSVFHLHKDPVVWSAQNQLSGDTIELYLKRKKPDSLRVRQHAFLAGYEQENWYNQVKGRQMYGRFVEGKLRWLLTDGNAELVYFNRRDSLILGSMARTFSKSATFWLDSNRVQRITLARKPTGKVYPIFLAEPESRLEGFLWRGHERPKRYLTGAAPPGSEGYAIPDIPLETDEYELGPGGGTPPPDEE